MVHVEKWVHKYNERLKYMETNLESRSSEKFSTISTFLASYMSDVGVISVRNRWTSPTLYFRTEEWTLRVRCTVKQVEEFMNDLGFSEEDLVELR